MDLPLCKICGDRHRLGGCPKFNAGRDQRQAWLRGMVSGAPKIESPAKADQHPQAQGASQKPEAPQEEIIQPGPARVEPVVTVAPPPTAPVKPKFDKNAYQRELMRKRRAAAKLKVRQSR